MAKGDNDKWKATAFADGGKVPDAGGRARFDALEQIGKGYQPPAPRPKPNPPPPAEPAYAGGGSIHIKPSHKGLMHKDLGKPAGAPITSADIAKEKQGGPAAKKRAVFAENAKKWGK